MKMATLIHITFSALLLFHLTCASRVPFKKMLKKRFIGSEIIRKYQRSNKIVSYNHDNQGTDLGWFPVHGEWEAAALEFESNECVYYDYKDECHKSKDGCRKRTVKCPERYGSHKRCYTMWEKNEKRLQGCWSSSGQICLPECLEETSGLPNRRTLHFCCCSGDNCNEIYGLKHEIAMQL